LRGEYLDGLNASGEIPELIQNMSNYKTFPVWAFHENNSDYFNPVYTNYTDAAADPNDANTVMMGGNPNDCVYFGNGSGIGSGDGQFDGLYIEVGNANTDMELVWEYYDGADWQIIPYSSITDHTDNLTQSGGIEFPESAYSDMAPVSINGLNTNWYRMRVLVSGTITPSAQAVEEATLRIPYKLYYSNTDMLGRPNLQLRALSKEIFTLEQCWANMDNDTFAGQFYGVMSEEGFTYTHFVEENNLDYVGIPGPINSMDVLSAQSIMMGMVIYTLLIVAIYTASYSVKSKYQVSEDKVSKWYDEITQKPGKKGDVA